MRKFETYERDFAHSARSKNARNDGGKKGKRSMQRQVKKYHNKKRDKEKKSIAV